MSTSTTSRTPFQPGWLTLFLVTLCMGGCTLGPDYQRPAVSTPDQFKEGATWTRANANPAASLSSAWWTVFEDPVLNPLVDAALKANPSIAASEAAYREALAEVSAARAKLFPTLTGSLAATRSNGATSSALGGSPTTAGGALTTSRTANSFDAGLQAAWEPDLWGSVRRTIEAQADLAQASDAQLAGERLSIAASVVTDYLLLRQADSDVQVLRQELTLEQRILDMTRDALAHGTASNDQLLEAENNADSVNANLTNELALRATYEHALAVLLGKPPAEFSIEPVTNYSFFTPVVPISVPSVLLQRRPDVVAAERTAAAANANIGVAQAAYFPTLDLSASLSAVANTLPNLVSVPTRVWSLGPSLSETIFDGGARSAQVALARATYDAEVATYRATVLTAFQNVEDSLAEVRQVHAQASLLYAVYERNQQLNQSIQAQLTYGIASQESVLNEQLSLIQARQTWLDTKSVEAQDIVALIKNLGGGWDGSTATAEGAPGSGTFAALQPVDHAAQ